MGWIQGGGPDPRGWAGSKGVGWIQGGGLDPGGVGWIQGSGLQGDGLDPGGVGRIQGGLAGSKGSAWISASGHTESHSVKQNHFILVGGCWLDSTPILQELPWQLKLSPKLNQLPAAVPPHEVP